MVLKVLSGQAITKKVFPAVPESESLQVATSSKENQAAI